MKIYENDGNVILENVSDFNVEHIFECGQCFHFEKLGELDYVTVAYGKALRVTQEGDIVTLHNTNMDEYNSIWKKYFDMETDYTSIKKWLIEKDSRIKESIDDKHGIRILKQEFNEMLLSFIISQNKQIPHIKQIVWALSERFGTFAGEIQGKKYYNFPTREAIIKITENDYRELKTGFRAPYLKAAANTIEEGLKCECFETLSYEEAKSKLKEIKGVGDKVANCILLFSLGYRNAFPVDVWVKRVMEDVYFHEDTSPDKIMQFAKDNFGEYGGYAQQYLFYHARDFAQNKG